MSYSGIVGSKSQQNTFPDFVFNEPEPKLNDDLSNVVVVDNLPQVPSSKSKLILKVLQKLLVKKSKLEVDAEDIFLAGDDNKTHGLAFVELKNKEQAEVVRRALDRFALDKSHTLTVNLVSDFDQVDKRLEELQKEFKPPQFHERPNLLSWLEDPERRDQFATREENEVVISWMDPLSGPQLDHRRGDWTEQVIQWSPHGRYLATFHQKGIALWGGADWSPQGRLEHPDVFFIDFSPQENFLVTWSKEKGTVFFWDVRTRKMLKGLSGLHDVSWPLFKWSHDERYFARIVKDGIFILETATMQPLSGTPIHVPNVCNFAWSPTDNTLSYWAKETEDRPARVTLVSVPTMQEVRQIDFFQVNHLEMYWQEAGDYLGVRVERIQDKAVYTSFELFHMRERGVPVSTITVEGKSYGFNWDPRGPRFAVIHGDQFSPTVSFHTLKTADSGQQTPPKTMEMRGANRVLYSGYKGYVAVLAMSQGEIEFWDADTGTMLGQRQHIMMTDAAWDPSGRFMASWVSRFQHQHENGYKIWNFFGQELLSKKIDRFWQFAWRPRPKLLSSGDRNWLKKNQKREEKKYEKKLMSIVSEKTAGEREHRRRKLEEWHQVESQLRKTLESVREQRREMGVVFDTDEDFEVMEEVIEEPVGQPKETIVKQ